MGIGTKQPLAMNGIAARGSEWSTGWPTLFAGFIAMTTAWNVVSIALSVFLLPMQAEFGWSRTALSIAPAASLLCAALLPVTGMALDRFGPRRIAIVGTVAMAVTLMLFSRSTASLAGFACLTVLLGLAGAAINSLVLARGVASWFSHRLGTALGLLFAGVSVALVVLIPLVGEMAAKYGWRAGFLFLSAVAVFVSLPALVIGFREPPAVSGTKSGDRPDAFGALRVSRPFKCLATACFLAAIPIGGVINHVIPMLAEGIGVGRASAFGSLFALAIGASGVITGSLFDRASASVVVAVTLTLSAIGNVLLAGLPAGAAPLHIAVTVVLSGLATGVEGNYITYFSARLFGVHNFARVVSLMALLISAGMALGGLGFSAAFDRFGGYAAALAVGAVLYLVAAGLFLALRTAVSNEAVAGQSSYG